MQRFNSFANSGVYAIITALSMLYAMFSDDVRQLFFPVGADIVFNYITLSCMTFYSLEIVLLSLFQVTLVPLRKTTSSNTTSGSTSSVLPLWGSISSGSPSISRVREKAQPVFHRSPGLQEQLGWALEQCD